MSFLQSQEPSERQVNFRQLKLRGICLDGHGMQMWVMQELAPTVCPKVLGWRCVELLCLQMSVPLGHACYMGWSAHIGGMCGAGDQHPSCRRLFLDSWGNTGSGLGHGVYCARQYSMFCGMICGMFCNCSAGTGSSFTPEVWASRSVF